MRLTGNLLHALREGNADAAIGSRWCAGAVCHNMPWHARKTSTMFDWITRIHLPPLHAVRDTQRGFKLFDAAVLKEIIPDMTEKGFAFDVELLLRATMAGYSIQEVPVSWFESRTASTLDLIPDAWAMFKSVRRFRREIYKRAPVKDKEPESQGYDEITLALNGLFVDKNLIGHSTVRPALEKFSRKFYRPY